jgi:hypothetical protein
MVGTLQTAAAIASDSAVAENHIAAVTSRRCFARRALLSLDSTLQITIEELMLKLTPGDLILFQSRQVAGSSLTGAVLSASFWSAAAT